MQWLVRYYHVNENLESLWHHVVAMFLVPLMRLKVRTPGPLVSKIAIEWIDAVLTR
jgi:hypothetical protein